MKGGASCGRLPPLKFPVDATKQTLQRQKFGQELHEYFSRSKAFHQPANELDASRPHLLEKMRKAVKRFVLKKPVRSHQAPIDGAVSPPLPIPSAEGGKKIPFARKT